MSKNITQALKTLLICACKNNKARMNIAKEYELNEHNRGHDSNQKIASLVQLYLKTLKIDQCLSILICKPNKMHKQILLFAIGRYYAPALNFLKVVTYNDESAKINIYNAPGYLAYFIFQNDQESCEKITALLQKKYLAKNPLKTYEEKKTLLKKRYVYKNDSALRKDRELSGKIGVQVAPSPTRNPRKIPQESYKKSKLVLEEKNVPLGDYQKLKQENAKLSYRLIVVQQSQGNLTREKKDLNDENTRLKDRIEELEDTIKYHAQVTSSNVKKTSLCVVEENSYGKFLKRLADFSDESLTVFKRNKEQRPVFENRDELFDKHFQNSEFTARKVGIWEWTAEPNLKSPEKDYITFHYCPDLCPIEIIDWRTRSLDDVKQLLKHGFQIQYWDMNLPHLFLISQQDQAYKALYCPDQQITTEKDHYKLVPNIFYLDEYELTTSDILKTSDAIQRRLFLRKLRLNKPVGRMLLDSFGHTIAHVIINYATNKNLMDLGFSRQDRKLIREFLTNVSSDTIYESICKLCHCTREEAQKNVVNFIKHAELYLTGNDESTAVLQLLVERNGTMREQYTSIIEKQWRDKHQAVLNHLEQLQTKLNQISEVLEDKQNKVDLLNQRLAREEDIAEQTQQKVRRKIQEARTDISSFLAELTIYMPQTATVQHGDTESLRRFIPGVQLDKNQIESINDIDDLTENITMNLEGTRVRYYKSVAAYLMAAYESHISLILAGPAALEIADAFSAGVCGHLAARLSCEGRWDSSVAKAAINSDDKVIVVENLFDGKWINHFPPMTLAANKLFIFVTPFKEDLAIVPAGLYNYMLPTFTEFFTDDDKQADGKYDKGNNYIASYWDGASREDSEEAKHRLSELRRYVEDIGLYGFMKSRVCQLLNCFQSINVSKNTFYSYLYCIVPLFYALGKADELYQKIDNSQHFDSDDDKATLLNFLKQAKVNI